MAKQYVDKEKFQALLLERRLILDESNEPLRVSEPIGQMIYLVCTNLSMRRNFVNHPHREDLAMEAAIVCIKEIDKYDPKNYKNPFAYFTTCAWRAMIKVIMKQYKYNDRLWKIYTFSAIEFLRDNPNLQFDIEHDLRRLDQP